MGTTLRFGPLAAAVIVVTCVALARPARADETPATVTATTTKPTTVPVTPYKVDHDAPLGAVERLVADEPKYEQFRVEFNGIERDRVPAFLYVPKNGQTKHPAVLLQYGSGGNKSTHYIVELGKQFVARGFLVLTIDVPNRGERRIRRLDPDTRRNRVAYLTSIFRNGVMIQTLGDYSRATDYLASRPDVDRERIGYAGISLGAITGLTFVAHEPRIAAMASIVGGANILGMMKFDWDPSVRAIAERIDPFYHVAGIAPRPLLLLNAKNDQLVPRFFGQQLHEAAGDDAKKVWVDTDHFFRGVDRMAVMEQVVDFMRESLHVPDKAR